MLMTTPHPCSVCQKRYQCSWCREECPVYIEFTQPKLDKVC